MILFDKVKSNQQIYKKEQSIKEVKYRPTKISNYKQVL